MEPGLAVVLRIAWAAGTLPILLACLRLPGAGLLHRILLGFAVRGKIMQPSSRCGSHISGGDLNSCLCKCDWTRCGSYNSGGPEDQSKFFRNKQRGLKKFTVPHRYFLHFYVVAVVLTTCLALSTWFYAYKKMVPLTTESLHYSTVASHLTGGSHMPSFDKSQFTPIKHKYRVWRSVFVLLLMEAQVLRRLHETLHVFSYSPSARMHILGYLTGLFFYTAAPLSLASTSAPEALSYLGDRITEFIVKGRERMPAFEFDWWEFLKPLVNLGWCQWIGATIFIWGWLHQLRCHAILGSLRDHRGTDEYVIPHGDWFEYVSCPHYLAEIVIYAGILVASGGSDITVWLLFLFVVCNLVFAAAETHRWYYRKFDNYPPSRRAIIPFIY